MTKKPTKIERLVTYLQQVAKSGRSVTRKQVLSRFRNDPSMIVYFNGLRRNGAINASGRIYVSRINQALSDYRQRNSTVQKEHYRRLEQESQRTESASGVAATTEGFKKTTKVKNDSYNDLTVL